MTTVNYIDEGVLYLPVEIVMLKKIVICTLITSMR